MTGFVYGLVRFVLYILFKALFGFGHSGSERVPKPSDPRGVILAPNHASYLDPPLLGISLKRPVTFLAKDYLFKHWLVGWVLRNIGAYAIKSDSGNDFRSIRGLVRILKEGACIAVFPEGTRSEDGKFKEPEDGLAFLAMKSGAWVVPVYLEGTYEAFPKYAKKFKRHFVQAHFGEPFIPAEMKFEGEGAEVYKAVSRRIMAEIAGIKSGLEKKVSE